MGTRTPGIEVNLESPWVRAAQAVLAEEYGRPAILVGSGGSIPVVTSLRSVLRHRQPADGLRTRR